MSENKNGGKPTPFNEETFKKLLDNESAKMELKKQQLLLQQQNLNKQHDYACKVLEAQKEHLKRSPREDRLRKLTNGGIAAFFLIVVLVFFGYCIERGKVEIVMQIIKYLGVALLSFVGGTFYGKSKQKKEDDNDDGFEYAEEVK